MLPQPHSSHGCFSLLNKGLFQKAKIRHKIGIGYAITVGLAIGGTIIGFVIGDYHYQRAVLAEQDALEERELTQQLQLSLLWLQHYQQQIVFLLDQPERLQEQIYNFLAQAARFQQVWETYKSTEGNTKNQEYQEIEGEVEGVQQFLQTYKTVPDTYFQQINQLFDKIRFSQLQPQEIEEIRQYLLEFNKNLSQNPIHQFEEALTERIQFADIEYKQAEAAHKAAQALQLQLIAGSLCLSGLIAILLAIYTSQAIAQPIEAVTQVAQRVTAESNFSLKAPVLTQDEIGVLSTAFNNLIDKVSDYTDSLETARQTLEIQNQQLTQTLENLQQTQAQLIQAEKMSSLGQLVAGIAHEINNPVSFIQGNLAPTEEYTQDLLNLIRLYQEYCPNPNSEIRDKIETVDLDFLRQDLPKMLHSMKVGTDRIRQIVQSLRTFSRLDEAELKPVNLHEGIDSALTLLQHRLQGKSNYPDIHVIKNYGNLPLVECYPGQINQVFINILANAVDAIETCDKSSPASLKPPQIILQTSLINENFIQIKIEDNGCGMTEEIQSRLFNPFFTTKAVGKGTGLGLATSYQIVKKHSGKIICTSHLGQGTQFIIQLPVRQQS